MVLAHELNVKLLLAGVAAGFVIENLSPAGDRMIQGIRSVAVVIFAFFFAIAGASLEVKAQSNALLRAARTEKKKATGPKPKKAKLTRRKVLTLAG